MRHIGGLCAPASVPPTPPSGGGGGGGGFYRDRQDRHKPWIDEDGDEIIELMAMITPYL